MIARVARWEPMPADDRDWVVEAAAAAGDAIRRRAAEIGWNDQPRPRFTSETFYQVIRGTP